MATATVTTPQLSQLKIYAVVPAGGSGLRAASDVPKQFHLIGGRPLLYYTLQHVCAAGWLKGVVLPVAQENVATVQQWIALWRLPLPVAVVLAGTTRHRSIFAGVQSVPADADVVIVHDAARPFVDVEILGSVALAAHAHGAAGCVMPLTSTVLKPTADGFLDHALRRPDYCASETPQAFRLAVIQEAYRHCTEDDWEHGTECLQLALAYAKTAAKLVPCPPAANTVWKVTYRHDLHAAAMLIREAEGQEAEGEGVVNALSS